MWFNDLELSPCLYFWQVGVVICDNTCKTNWYDMYLNLLVVIYNNTKIRLVCQGLSEDETSGSYQWFFQCLRDAIGNLAPQVLFSDSEPALINAVSIIIPENKAFFIYISYTAKYT